MRSPSTPAARQAAMPGKARRLPRLFALCAALGFGGLLLAFAALWLATPDPLPAVLGRPASPVLLDREGHTLHVRLSADGEWRLPVPLADMGRWLPAVLVAVEDKRFFSHPGVDPLALGRALAQNLSAGRVVSGASTISSQLVRLSLPRERTLLTKALEFVAALKLERRLSKDDILEAYLNAAPFGGVIRGAEAAARLYFGKRAKDLSLGEAALLVGLLKGPTAYRPDRNPEAALKRRQHIIAAVAAEKAVPADMAALALAEPLPRFSSAMPAAARHFADFAFRLLPPEGGVLRSSLDADAQRMLEDTLAESLRRAGADVTAAAVIMDNREASILAYVGNARFNAAGGKHWVDCALAPRSPGSALKPFIYLAAMDKGLIIPASLLADTPLQLGGEAPRNFDRLYRGPVTAGAALADSLNAPAVRVLRAAGLAECLAFLRGLGFAHLNRPDTDYGDSLALGAGEVTVLEMARAYSTLARLGDDREPGPLAPAGGGGGASSAAFAPALYSRAAAFLILDCLADAKRLSLAELLRQTAPAAVKTGTSFGLRDAWAAACTPGHTVVVWFGRESGAADPGLVGLHLAAPAALKALERLDPAPAAFRAPDGVGRAPVCALSGAAPSPLCPETREAAVIPAVWRTRPCGLHVLKDGAVSVDWPPELEDFNRKRFAGRDYSRQPLIVSPLPGARYLLTPGNRGQSVALRAEGVRYPVHWYADGRYLGRQDSAGLPLYWRPERGGHSLSLLDADGKVGRTDVRVSDLAAGDESPPPRE